MRLLSFAVVLLVLVGCGASNAHPDGAIADASADGTADVAVGDGSTGDATMGGYCPVVGYAACGGDLVGTWSFRALCPEDPVAAAALCEHPFDDREVCMGAGNEAACDGGQTGTLTFAADGSIDIDTTTTLVGTYDFTDACLAAVATSGTTPAEHCASLANPRLTCTYDASCTCVGDPLVETSTNTATYAVVGDEVTIGDDPPATYCVDGDRLTMDYYLFHPISWRYWVLERE